MSLVSGPRSPHWPDGHTAAGEQCENRAGPIYPRLRRPRNSKPRRTSRAEAIASRDSPGSTAALRTTSEIRIRPPSCFTRPCSTFLATRKFDVATAAIIVVFKFTQSVLRTHPVLNAAKSIQDKIPAESTRGASIPRTQTRRR